MGWLKQTVAVMLLNLRMLPGRLGSSSVAIIGIAGVVVIFVSVLSISEGFYAAMTGAGSTGRALILRGGSDTEMTSGLPGTQTRVVKEAPGIRREGTIPVASAETYVVIDVPKKSTPDSPANVPMRGIESTAMQTRNEISIVEGRMFRFGTNEVIAGKAASRQFINLNVGDTIVSGVNRWPVVGLFEADGGVAETEIWCDAHILQGVYGNVGNFNSVLATLDSPESFNTLHDWLMTNPQTDGLTVMRENEYYASRSEMMTRLINTLGFGIASLMGIGAIFGAVLTMYTAVSARTREIATLRALGFNTTSVVVSVLTEAMMLGVIGGVVGGGAAYLAFNGFETSTMNFQTFSQVAFAFRVTPRLLLSGLVYALSIGLIGGLLPAIRAARLPITSALREL
jgi:putative ABC transport system permease protein